MGRVSELFGKVYSILLYRLHKYATVLCFHFKRTKLKSLIMKISLINCLALTIRTDNLFYDFFRLKYK